MEVSCKLKDIIIHNKNEFYIEYFAQPIYSPKNLKIACYEVLSKVYQDQDDILNSKMFYRANDSDMSKKVILKQVDYFSKKNLKKPFFINMALSNLEDNDFVEELQQRADRYFCIEISDLDCSISEKITANIKRLQNKGNGINFSLDHYHHHHENANFSLGVIEWDYIKIDKSFLYQNLENSMQIRSMIFVLSVFCKRSIILDGVETHFTLDVLKQHDVLVQGFYRFPPKRC